jgi:hypothetical protein
LRCRAEAEAAFAEGVRIRQCHVAKVDHGRGRLAVKVY